MITISSMPIYMPLRSTRHPIAFCLLTLLLLFVACRKNEDDIIADPDNIVETLPPELVKVSTEVNPAIRGYIISLPQHYPQTKKTYPTLVFFHGLGQIGNGDTELQYLLNDGMGRLLDSGKFPPDFVLNNEHHSFLVICPQMDTTASIEDAESFLAFIFKNYRIDPHRLYIGGMSFGANLATRVVAGLAKYYSALLPISGVPVTPGIESRCERIAAANLPVWAFHNQDDPTSDVNEARDFVQRITDLQPAVLPKLTVFDVFGHDAWTTALDPSYKENGMNIYEWMLQYSR